MRKQDSFSTDKKKKPGDTSLGDFKFAEEIASQVALQRDECYSEANFIIDNHMLFLKRMNEKARKANQKKTQSILGVCSQTHGNGLFYTRWYVTHYWNNKKGNFTPRSFYLSKGKGDKYNLALLKRYAKDWEVEQVIDTERRLATVRRKMHYLSNIMASLRQFEKQEVGRGKE